MLAIRAITEDDIDLLLPLLMDMEQHYGRGGEVAPDVARVRTSDGLVNTPGTLMLIAVEGAALGFASFARAWPGFHLEPMYYMKEMYVLSTARGGNVGEQLLREGARRLIARGATRLDFSTGGQNHGAQRFYDRIGVPRVDKVPYSLKGEELVRLAKEERPAED